MTHFDQPRDHGGGIDAAAARFGGTRSEWLDLSTGINPVPYPVGTIPAAAWSNLPDRAAGRAAESAARDFWSVPEEADLVLAPGASALIARLPDILRGERVSIAPPTYNEHAAAFRAHGWCILEDRIADADLTVMVHPNNPDGRLHEAPASGNRGWTVIDESFCDTCPENSFINLTSEQKVIVLKSFGKFWGLAGLRLGAMVGPREPCDRMRELLGPWPVSGPALEIAARALRDTAWATETRQRLKRDSARLDDLIEARGARLVGGTTLFRTYHVDDAIALRDHLANARIWVRVFPYSRHWVRVGLPGNETEWERLTEALA